MLRGDNNYAGEIGILPIGNSYLNDILYNPLDDVDYCNTILNTIRIITSIINPKIVVLGGDEFRYELAEKIIETYKAKYKISTNILLEDVEKNYALLGITKLALNLINEEFKLVNG